MDGSLGRGLEAMKPAAEARRPAREDELRPGVKVWVPRLRSTVEVLEAPARGQVRVAAGAMKLLVSTDDLQRSVDPGETAEPVRHAPRHAPRGEAVAESAELERALRTDSNTCDVRGLRVDDATGMVDAFLDRVLGAGDLTGFVLHGHGTGALKAAVREHLKRTPWVRASRAADPEDGGDAFTVFWLRR